MKAVLIADTHFGVGNGKEVFLKSQLRFFREQLIPYMQSKGLDTIIHLGDFFHNRSNINVKIKNEVFDLLENDLSEFKIYMIVGNHDTFYKTTIDVHSLKFLKKFSNIEIIDDIQKHNIGGKDVLFVPWQTDPEKFRLSVANKNTHCDICFGHFEISGFKMNKSSVCKNGLKTDMFFKNFDLIFSGHFHKRGSKKRGGTTIQYIGSPYQMDRNDMGNKNGLCVLDFDKMSYRFVENEVSAKYIKLKYPEEISEEKIKDNFVDVEVDCKDGFDEKKVQEYLDEVESLNPALPPVPSYINVFTERTDDDFEAQRDDELIKEYVDSLELENPEEIYDKFMVLYKDCKGVS